MGAAECNVFEMISEHVPHYLQLWQAPARCLLFNWNILPFLQAQDIKQVENTPESSLSAKFLNILGLSDTENRNDLDEA